MVTSFGGFELADPNTEEAVATDDGPYVADWTLAIDPVEVSELDVPEGRYKFSFSELPASADATNLNGVDSDIVDEMVANGWNTYLDIVATKGDVTNAYHWGMANAAHYAYCKNGVDETDGVAVSAGESTDATMFIHADHTWWDRLGTEEASLRNDVIAAWADDTGETSLDSLSAVSTANIEDPDGNPILDENGDPLLYDDAGLGLSNLKDFIVYSTERQGHLNGEGQCTVTDL
jgi:hypothetical protein